MQSGNQNRRIPIVLGAIGAAAVALAAVEFSMTPVTNRAEWPSEYRSNGERIYYTGTSGSGQAIRASGGDRRMSMMGSNACVACHGADLEGGRLRPSYLSVAPAITAEALLGDHADEDDHAHDAYDRASLAVAISTGRRPDGSEIGPRMPRWSMSPEDLSDIVAFLLPEPGA